jgi:tRNA (guanine-N7-)-methyltransferase
MRQKNIKRVDEKIKFFSDPLVDVPAAFKGRWREAFACSCRDGSDGAVRRPAACCGRVPLNLEIGCGKGMFIEASARRDPDSLYLGFEGHMSVIYRALQRAYAGPDAKLSELNEVALALIGLNDGGRVDGVLPADGRTGPPENLLFCAEYIADMGDYFADGELDGVFLNFSDPWPKSRQRKRRLTSPGYLDGYVRALSGDGFVRFKTDSADFFEYSRECFEAHRGFELTALTCDLHASEYAADSEMTEYEKRFINLNRKIHYLEARRLVKSDEFYKVAIK